MNGAAQTQVTYRVVHETEYTYAAEVMHAHQLLHLKPRAHSTQHCGAHQIAIEPTTMRRRDFLDAFDNPVTSIEISEPHRHLLVSSTLLTTVTAPPSIDSNASWAWNRVRDHLGYAARPRTAQDIEAAAFRMESPHVRLKRGVLDFARACFPRNQPLLVCTDALLAKLHRELDYAPRETHIGTSVMELLDTRRGVCQDFAHLMIACLRAHGQAARYVSGYLRTVAPPGQEKLVGTDASHAWVSVYAPPFGWVDYDPTNGVRAGTDHITLAWGRDFSDVSPLRGVIVGGGTHSLDVRVTVSEEP